MDFRLDESPRERRKAAWENASALLHSSENRLVLVLVCLASTVVSFLTYFVVQSAFYALYQMLLAETLEQIAFVLWFFLQLFTVLLFILLAMPLWFGTYRMAICIVDGQNVKAWDVFHYIIDKEQYARAVGLSMRLLVYWIPALVGFWIMQLFFGFHFVGFLLICFFAITVVLSLLWVSRLGGVVTLVLGDDMISFDSAKKMAAAQIEGERMCVFGFYLDMAWRILLSLIPVGVIFILHTLPVSMLSAVCYSRRMAARKYDKF